MTSATAQLIRKQLVRTTSTTAASARLYAVNQPAPAPDRSAVMYLLAEELTRDRIDQRRRDADAYRLVRVAVLARRDKRSAAKAVLRRRVVALAAR